MRDQGRRRDRQGGPQPSAPGHGVDVDADLEGEQQCGSEQEKARRDIGEVHSGRKPDAAGGDHHQIVAMILHQLDESVDRFLAGDKNAISDAAKRGWELFNGKARCNSCHGRVDVVPTFTDNKYHNIGVAAQKQDFVALAREALQVVRTGDRKQIDELAIQSRFSELGRFMVTKEQKDVGAFKTSGLRNVELTAPYMHDGSEATLKDVIDFYDRGGTNNPFLDGGIRPLNLTDQEKADLVELMKTFTSDDLKRFEPLKKLAAPASQ